jgi:hypothetical protein
MAPVIKNNLSTQAFKVDQSAPSLFDHQPNEMLTLIFFHALKRGEASLLAIRSTCKNWKFVLESILLPPLWAQAEKLPQIHRFSFLLSPIKSHPDRECIVSWKFYQLFSLFNMPPYHSRVKGPPYPPIDLREYEVRMSEILDHSLINLWDRITQDNSHAFFNAPSSSDYKIYPQLIRTCLNDLNNKVIIQQITALDLSVKKPKNVVLIDRYKFRVLPPEIGLFTHLKKLVLDEHRLGDLAEEIGYLTKLEILFLNHNELTTLPQCFSHLIALRMLDMNNNAFRTFPEGLEQLTNLQMLDLSYNRLKSLSLSIGEMTALKGLWLKGNQLKTLPQAIGNLRNLRILSLEQNPLVTLPQTISQLGNVNRFKMSRSNCILFLFKNIKKPPPSRTETTVVRGAYNSRWFIFYDYFPNRTFLDQFTRLRNFPCESPFGQLCHAMVFGDQSDIQEKLDMLPTEIFDQIQRKMKRGRARAENRTLLNKALVEMIYEKFVSRMCFGYPTKNIFSYIFSKGGQLGVPCAPYREHDVIFYPRTDNIFLVIDALELADH